MELGTLIWKMSIDRDRLAAAVKMIRMGLKRKAEHSQEWQEALEKDILFFFKTIEAAFRWCSSK